MVNAILLFPGFFQAKRFYPLDGASKEAVSRASREGLVLVFSDGGVGLSKRGRQVRRQLEIRKFSGGNCNE